MLMSSAFLSGGIFPDRAGFGGTGEFTGGSIWGKGKDGTDEGIPAGEGVTG